MILNIGLVLVCAWVTTIYFVAVDEKQHRYFSDDDDE
jgi:hypothetical protein